MGVGVWVWVIFGSDSLVDIYLSIHQYFICRWYGVNKHERQQAPVAILPNTPAVLVDRWMDGWVWILVEGGSRVGNSPGVFCM